MEEKKVKEKKRKRNKQGKRTTNKSQDKGEALNGTITISAYTSTKASA